MKYKSTICTIRIAGIPNLNAGFFVLCLNVYIPSNAPAEPPIIDNRNNTFSGILHLFFTAFNLSIPKTAKVIKFIIIK